MENIKIENETQLEEALGKAIADIDALKDAIVEIDPKLLHIRILFTGDRFESSLPTSAMLGLLGIQDLIYEVYRQTKPQGTRITQEEKRRLELVVKIEKGSTDVNIDVNEVLKHMTGDQILIGVGILTFAWIVVTIGKQLIVNNSKKKLAEIEQMKKAETEVSKRALYQTFENMFQGVTNFRDGFVKRLAATDAREIDVGETKTTPAAIAAGIPPTKRPRKEQTDKVFTGEFKIVRIDIDDEEGTFIDAVHLESGTLLQRVNILASFISADDYNWLKDAVADGKGKP